MIFVSTDCERIAHISRKYGAQVHFMRSAEASDDHATTLDVLKEVLNEFEKRATTYNRVLCLYPVTPLVRASDLVQGLDKLEKAPDGLVLPVIEYSHPIWRAISIENNLGKRIWDENSQSRTQDLQPTYHDAGQWYWLKAETVITKDALGNLPLIPVIVDETQAQDVDTLSDWKLLELKFQALKK